MMRQDWREILEMARLTARQREVFCLRAMGHTYEEIGRKNGHTKQGAQNIFLQAVKKIRAAYYVYPYAGLAQVYREQTICRSFERR